MCTCPGFPVDSILLAKLTSLDQTSNLNRVLPTMPHKTVPVPQWSRIKNSIRKLFVENLELVSKELNHLAAILHVYAGGLNFMK